MNTKQKKYHRIVEQLRDLLTDSSGLVAQMATINAILYHKMQNFSWVGFYFVNGNKLIVGPYQGPVACQILKKPNGACWASVISKDALIVPDVEEFPGHIACDARTKSEIVIPIKDSKGDVFAVLDIDSHKPDQFDTDDKNGLLKIIETIRLDSTCP